MGNVFRHTEPGTAFAVRLERAAQAVTLIVEDAGPGVVDPDGALARGASTTSTGLGLDIARRAAATTGGDVRVAEGRLGGALVAVTLGLASSAVAVCAAFGVGGVVGASGCGVHFGRPSGG